ncbi:MAG: UDP-3-O-(3-hydroxymyristoyl)glucosamine N-acyltransferase, partial [Paracoccaceae bacterium]|nr:UDP-3-O-(3-hydroxymyristoyl)glucosamine N-acyltransferase [Paracoccaceae bacterium]
MSHIIAEIAAALGLQAKGDVDLRVARVAEPAMAGPDDLALAMRPDYAEGLADGAARAALLWDGADWQSYGLQAAILAPRPRFAMSGLSAMMDPGAGYAPGHHPSAVIDASAELGVGVSVGPLAVIGPDARIGPGSVIGPQVFIGAGATIGEDALLHAGVRIGHKVHIGARFVAHPGAAVGADGFSFV